MVINQSINQLIFIVTLINAVMHNTSIDNTSIHN